MNKYGVQFDLASRKSLNNFELSLKCLGALLTAARNQKRGLGRAFCTAIGTQGHAGGAAAEMHGARLGWLAWSYKYCV